MDATIAKSILGYSYDPTKIVDVNLAFEAASEITNRQIVEKLRIEFSEANKEEASISYGQLQPYPFATFHIVAGAQRQTEARPAIQVYEYPVVPLQFSQDTVLARAVSFPTQLSAELALVRGSCEALVAAADYGDLTAYILTPFDRIGQNTVNIVYSAIFESAGYIDVFRQESQTGTVEAETQSSGQALNLITSFLGASADTANTSITTSDNRRRAVSGDVVERIASQFSQTVYARIISADPQNANIFNASEIASRAERILTESAAKVSFDLKDGLDGNLELVLGDRTVGLAEGQNILAGSAAPNNELSSSTTVTTNDGVKHDANTTGKFTIRGASIGHILISGFRPPST